MNFTTAHNRGSENNSNNSRKLQMYYRVCMPTIRHRGIGSMSMLGGHGNMIAKQNCNVVIKNKKSLGRYDSADWGEVI